MPIRKAFLAATIAALALSATTRPSLAEVLKREPPMGQLREGQIVLVDDGTCPAGQIKQVTGGNHVKVGGTKNIVRTYKCIPH